MRWTWMLAAAMAATPEAEAPDAPAADTPTIPTGGSMDPVQVVQAPAPPPPMAPGLYRLDMLTVTTADVSYGTHRTYSRTLAVAEITGDAAGLQQTHTTCDAFIKERPAIFRTQVSDAWLANLPTATYPVTLAKGADGFAYRASTGLERVGWTGGLGDSEPPASADDPRVVDMDRDGHPGATVSLRILGFPAADIYVAQVSTTELKGTLGDDGAVVGTARQTYVKQTTLGSTRAAFADPDRETPTLGSEIEGSHFRLEPMPTGTSCATVPYPDDWPEGLRRRDG